MIKIFLIVASLILVSCASPDRARFYHTDLGVVDGNNEKLMLDSQYCALEYKNTKSSSSDSTLTTIGTVARDVGENALGNIALATVLLKQGYKFAKKQSSCMVQRGWQKLESAK